MSEVKQHRRGNTGGDYGAESVLTQIKKSGCIARFFYFATEFTTPIKIGTFVSFSTIAYMNGRFNLT